MSTRIISNNLKRLLNISLLLSITIFGNINTYATQSLKDHLNDSTNTIAFNNITIDLNGTDVTTSINSE